MMDNYCDKKLTTNNSLFSCSICMREYSEDDIKPRCLPCGHSYCLTCLMQIFKTGKNKCPECETVFSKNVDSIPVNYAIIRAIRDHAALESEKMKPTTTVLVNFMKGLENFEEKLLKEEFQLQSTLKELIDKKITITNWKQFISAMPESMKCHTIENINEIFQNWLEEDTNSKPVEVLHNLIPVLLKVRGEGKVVAVTYIEGKSFYGRITEGGPNTLHVHAFEPPKHHKNVSYVINFQNIKDFLNDEELKVFLDLQWFDSSATEHGGRIYINLGRRTLAKQFYYLCSGERGLSYKGCTSEKKENLIRVSCPINNKTILGNVNYNNNKKFYCDKGLVYATEEDYSFFIVPNNFKNELPFRIGQVTEGLDVLQKITSQNRVFVKDCGLVVSNGLQYPTN